MSHRAEKLANELRKAMTEPIRDIASELKAGIATVTAVRVSDDLSFARVYMSAFGGKIPSAAFVAALDARKGEVRKFIAPLFRLRFIPDLKFFLDDTLDEIDRVQKLLDEADSDKHKLFKDAVKK